MSERSSGGGTGAWLAIVKRIIEVHGGRMRFQTYKDLKMLLFYTTFSKNSSLLTGKSFAEDFFDIVLDNALGKRIR